MARLLRMHLHDLRRSSHLLSSPSSLAALRGIQVSKYPELKKDARRWFGENAVAEEFYSSMQSSKDSLRSDKDANQGDRCENKVVSGERECRDVTSPTESGALKSSGPRDTEKLTKFVIGSFKGTQNATNNNKGFVNKKHTGSKINIPQGGSDKFNEHKAEWQKVINTIRESTAKPRQDNPSPSRDQPRSSREPSSQTEDDFADLDLPQGIENKAGVSGSSNSSSRPSLVADAFDKEMPKSRHANNDFHGLHQQKPKEPKGTDSDFLKFKDTYLDPLKSSHTSWVPAGARISDKSFPRTEETVSRPMTTVCVQNLPASCNVALIKDALSVYGEVTGSFKRVFANGSCVCYIEFKTDEAKEEALAVRWIQLDSKVFPIVRVDRPLSTVVRLYKVSMETTESEILLACKGCGNIDSIKRRGNGVFDVYFKVDELPNILKILDSLNEVTIHRSRWVAIPAPVLHPAVKKDFLKSREAQAWHLSQMNRMLNRIEAGIENVSVFFEDLKVLGSMEKEFEQSLGK